MNDSQPLGEEVLTHGKPGLDTPHFVASASSAPWSARVVVPL